MTQVPITYVGKDYDYLSPLACGDVRAEGIALTLNRIKETMAGGGAQARFLSTPSIEAGEFSFSLYLVGLSRGDRSLVGIPFFPYRGFRHRCLYVHRDSGIRTGKELEGKRVGLNAWKPTGNTWTRAALREEGVNLERIDWLVGPMDVSGRDSGFAKPEADWPPNVHLAPEGRNLEAMLMARELDAIMCPAPPQSYYGANSEVVRLFRDYRKVERDYYLRTRVYPAIHTVVLRRETFERNPWVARSLYLALEQTKARWQERLKAMAEATPWIEEEIEETVRVFGADWQPSGVEANISVIKALCEEEYAQGLVKQPIDPSEVFAEFNKIGKA